ncbi:hypothetical protein RhiirC2_855345 [Rhizophagus irregularis]|uniref:Uncharacterized protein n=1 Tax=Rhizophagus irregularis TaxID=588596 RepID=A0A2N1MMV3_9GLOM|nr:hypothetical protein RhiirC2_855345 [Rhizophagus irregularis]
MHFQRNLENWTSRNNDIDEFKSLNNSKSVTLEFTNETANNVANSHSEDEQYLEATDSLTGSMIPSNFLLIELKISKGKGEVVESEMKN